MGIKYFLQQLVEELDEIDVVTKTSTQQQIHNARFNRSNLIREGLQFLSTITGNAAVGMVDGEMYYAGLSTMLNVPEFSQVSKLKQIMAILEDYALLSNLFRRGENTQGVKVLIGEEDTGLSSFEDYAVVYTDLELHKGERGFIAVIGPNRMNYKKVIPAVEFIADSINSSATGWR
jgi:transcriptional regulator of heat shock response